MLQSEYHSDGRTIVIGFGADAGAGALDIGDVDPVQSAIDRLAPSLRVLDAIGHDWVDDPLSGETWPMHRVGYLSKGLPALARPHGRIRLAGSDLARG